MKRGLSLAVIGSLLFAIVSPVSAVSTAPYAVAAAKTSGLCKATEPQSYKSGKWTTFAGCEPFDVGGPRSLFFAQLHLDCEKRPRWVKIRLARLLPDGTKDTTGTNTWTLGPDAPIKWQGTTWWESKTKHPIVAQFKVGGGKCVSSERQLKWWTP
jgi:hypothetical protein